MGKDLVSETQWVRTNIMFLTRRIMEADRSKEANDKSNHCLAGGTPGLLIGPKKPMSSRAIIVWLEDHQVYY